MSQTRQARIRPARLSDLDRLYELGKEMERAANCGLGQTAFVPIRDTLKHFRAEVEAHIRLGVCPTGVCPMVAADKAQVAADKVATAVPA